jgi:hypothetical protein
VCVGVLCFSFDSVSFVDCYIEKNLVWHDLDRLTLVGIGVSLGNKSQYNFRGTVCSQEEEDVGGVSRFLLLFDARLAHFVVLGLNGLQEDTVDSVSFSQVCFGGS